MSISAMKQALEALEFAGDLIAPITENCQCQICLAHTALKQAIEQAECDAEVYSVWVEQKPVHAIDMSQERVDETAKREHEWVGLTDEERGMVVNANFGIGVWEMARAIEAKLREKNGG